MGAIHDTASDLAGQVVTVDIGNGPVEYDVEDWWDRVNGQSWMRAQYNPAAIKYAVRTGLLNAVSRQPIPTDDEVLYGKIDGLGYLVHISEVAAAGSQAAAS